LPEKGRVRLKSRANWEFPVGTVLVKSFLLAVGQRPWSEMKRLETRLFVHAEHGWQGYTYVWNDEQTEAHLLDDAFTKTFRVETPEGPIEQPWYFPSRADCMACHTKAAGFVLGLNTRQMNRTSDYAGIKVNQIVQLDRLGVFTEHLSKPPADMVGYPAWPSPSATTETLARAYLDVNCAFCHSPGGVAGSRPDLRFHTPLKEMSLLGRRPGQGRLGPDDSALITPGKPGRSELLHRLSTRGPRQMPPLASNVKDKAAIAVLRRWIEGLPLAGAQSRRP
jgi:uncharacterized repeat protein (TIGR03806 family)